MNKNKIRNYTISKNDAFTPAICPVEGQPGKQGDPPTLEELSQPPYNGFCLSTPDKFQITIFEMGLCTENPLTGVDENNMTFNTSNCFPTMSSSGSTADLASTDSVSLPSMSAPPNGSYPFAYIKLSNQFGLNASYTVKNAVDNGTTTFYSTPATNVEGDQYGATTTEGPAEDFTETLNNMNFGSSENNDNGFDFADQNVGVVDDNIFKAYMPFQEMSNNPVTGEKGGKVAALLLERNRNTTATRKENAKSMVGVFETNNGSPVILTELTQGLEVALEVTNGGIAVVVAEDRFTIEEFGSAPFKPFFSTF